MRLLAAVFSVILLLWVTDGRAQPVQPVPALSARVIDRSATLNATQLQALEQKLARFEAERGSQIVVLMVPTTAPEDIAAYAYRVADNWKIGRRGRRRHPVDRHGVAGACALRWHARSRVRCRLAAYQIIDRLITPAFRQTTLTPA